MTEWKNPRPFITDTGTIRVKKPGEGAGGRGEHGGDDGRGKCGPGGEERDDDFSDRTASTSIYEERWAAAGRSPEPRGAELSRPLYPERRAVGVGGGELPDSMLRSAILSKVVNMPQTLLDIRIGNA